MKLSLRFAEKISGNQLPTASDQLLDKIGAQLGAIEEVQDLKPIYDSALIVRLVDVKPLTNSEHLNVCLVDDNKIQPDVERNEDGLIQVVCGAPNVKVNMLAVWLPPGAIVPSSAQKEPFKLSVRSIMGVSSNGMLASSRELAIGDDHEGIVQIDALIGIGSKLVDYLQLDDQIIDIENKMFTHRPDLFGQLGIARELAGIYQQPFKSPDWYSEENKLISEIEDGLSVDNQLLNKECPRFMAVVVDNIKISSSPLWLSSYLSRCGIRPINNIVDLTNYVMLATGQPLHAYDYHKLTQDNQLDMVIRKGLPKEKLVLLDGRSIELSSDDIVIANTQQALGLGGIMGGQNSEIESGTTKIVLECANFDMYTIRRSAMYHGIFSEAVTRYTKGQSPLQCPVVLNYAFSLLEQLCPTAILASAVADTVSQAISRPKRVEVDLSQLSDYLGISLPEESIESLLDNVELKPIIKENQLSIQPAFWRTDLSSSEDIIEEVARLYGYDNLPAELPKRNLTPPDVPIQTRQKELMRQTLSAAGANEVLTYSFVHQKLLTAASQDLTKAFRLANAISPELMYYRISLTPSLLSKVHSNHKAGHEQFTLFEIGAVHATDLIADNLPIELPRLALVVSTIDKLANKKYSGAAYYQAKKYLEFMLAALNVNISKLSYIRLDITKELSGWQDSSTFWDQTHSAVIKYEDNIVGIIGEFSESVRRNLKLPRFISGFEIDLTWLSEDRRASYRTLSRYPTLNQDLTINVAADISYRDILDRLNQSLQDELTSDMSAALSLLDIYQAEGSTDKSWTLRLITENFKRTMTDSEVSKIVEALKAMYN